MKKEVAFTNLECAECQCRMPIARLRSKQKKAGHVKHMYCPKCKETRAFIEVKDLDKNVAFWDNFFERVETEGMNNYGSIYSELSMAVQD